MASKLTIFTGTANPDLASNIVEELGIPAGVSELIEFPDGEMRAELHQSVRGDDVYLIQSTSPPAERHLVELMLIADACARAGAARMTAVIPYFGYARQDRRTSRRQALGARVFASMIGASAIGRLVLVDLHTAAIEGFFAQPVEHLTAVPTLAARVRSGLHDHAVIVAPDLGAVKLAERYAQALERPMAIVHKSRVSGREVSVKQVIGDVRDRVPIIVDDMLSTGSTIEAAFKALVAAGAQPRTTVIVSHGLFAAPAEDLLAPLGIERILTTDSVTQHPYRLPVEVLSLGPLLAEAVRRLHADESFEGLYAAVLSRSAAAES